MTHQPGGGAGRHDVTRRAVVAAMVPAARLPSALQVFLSPVSPNWILTGPDLAWDRKDNNNI